MRTYDVIKNDGYKAARKIKAPTIIAHGDSDESVPYKQSVKVSKIIKNCQLHTIKGANHLYDNPVNYKEMIEVLTDFIIKKFKLISVGLARNS